ncbi:MAG: serine/threonine protein kinase [Kofleriaceae bacterium]|nr:serine/threonine protein kinase [Kofleriaceae bacterium]
MLTSLGAFEVVHALSSGGMGDVLLARRRGPGGFEQLAAIKTIRPELAGTAAVRAMFLDEAAILARLGHPAVAAVHDFGEQGGTLYLVMEYVAGVSFRTLVERGAPPLVVAQAVAEAARGLHAAHELRDLGGGLLGVVHRDISPDNLMLGFDGHVKVIDFGIALVRGRQAPVTELGTVKGKPPYMSPEQVKNEPIDRRSDVFSLGVVLHELLTGRPLFDGDSLYAVARAVEHQVIAPPSRRAPAVPAALDAVVLAALARPLGERLPTAAALAEALSEVVRTTGGPTLEAWAAAHLAADAAAHRAWLAGVLGGGGGAAGRGRATGAVTAVGPVAVGGAAPASAPVADPQGAIAAPVRAGVEQPRAASGSTGSTSGSTGGSTGSTALSALDVAPVPGRGRRVVLALGLLLLVVGLGWFGLQAVRSDRARVSTTADARVMADAGVITPIALADARIADAADVPIVVDAASPAPRADARVRASAADASRAPVDASSRVDAAPARADAAAASVPTGVGRLTITADPFAYIRLDGKDLGATPLIKAEVAAGSHEVVLLWPDSGAVRVRRTVEVRVGATTTLAIP